MKKYTLLELVVTCCIWLIVLFPVLFVNAVKPACGSQLLLAVVLGILTSILYLLAIIAVWLVGISYDLKRGLEGRK
jgi:hypothetical protein